MFPDMLIQQQPELLMSQIWVLYHHFNISKIPSVIDAVEALLKDTPNKHQLRGEVNFFHGYISYFQNQGSQSLKQLKEALKMVPDECHEIRSQTEILYGLASQMQGHKEHAINRLNNMLNSKQAPLNIRKTRLLATLVYIHIISGDLDKALGTNQRLFEYATKGKYHYAKLWSLYLQGLIHYYRNELDRAMDHFDRAIDQKYIFHSRAVVDSMAGLIFSYQAKGQSDRAGETLQSLFDYVGFLDDPAYSIVSHSCKVRLSIMQGELKLAMNWLQKSSPPVENMLWWLEIPAVTHCRALLAQGSDESLEKAETQLGELLQLNQDNNNICQTIQMMPLLAMVYQKQGRVDKALTILGQAVDFANSGGWVRPFVEWGSPMTDLLKQLIKKNITVDFVGKLFVAFKDKESEAVPDETESKPAVKASVRPQPLVEPLTNRELDILELIAQRLQNKEIAAKLFISTETVKTHLNNIYQKLNVKNRRDAVEKARSLGII